MGKFNLGMVEDLRLDFKENFSTVLQEYKVDVFIRSYKDIEGLNPEFYQHKVNLAQDANLV